MAESISAATLAAFEEIKKKYGLQKRYQAFLQDMQTYGIALPSDNSYGRALGALEQYEKDIKEGKATNRVGLITMLNEGSILWEIANAIPEIRKKIEEEKLWPSVRGDIFARREIYTYLTNKAPNLSPQQKEDLMDTWAGLKKDLIPQYGDFTAAASVPAAPEATAQTPVTENRTGGGLLDDDATPVPVFGVGALSSKQALTTEVTDILNKALNDKPLADMVDGVKAGQVQAMDFFSRLNDKIVQAANQKYGVVNNKNTSMVRTAVGEVLKDILQTGPLGLLSVQNYFSKVGDHYQLSPQGVSGFADPIADKILKNIQSSAATATPPAAPPPAAVTPPAPAAAAPPPAAAAAPPPAAAEATPPGLPQTIGGPRLLEGVKNNEPAAEYEVGMRYAEGKGVTKNDAEAISWLTRAAEKDYAPAQYQLGAAYENGTGVKQDLAKARKFYQSAAGKNYPEAMHSLAILAYDGKGGPKNDFAAEELFRGAAERGLPKSQYNLARFYQNGIGVDQDLVQAYKWFSIARKNGEARADPYLKEIEGQLNAEELAKAKAEAGSFQPKPPEGAEAPPPNWDAPAPAQVAPAPAAAPSPSPSPSVRPAPASPPPASTATPRELPPAAPAAPVTPASPPPTLVPSALLMRAPAALPEPIGLPRLRKAAEAKNPEAEYEVGRRYAEGKGVPKNDDEAAIWFGRAAQMGHAAAQGRLGLLYQNGTGVPEDITEARKLYKSAAEKYDPEAMYHLARLAYEGKGGPQDYVAAAEWFRKAAEQGHPKSQYNLGLLYQNGIGVDRDLAQAYKWFRIAKNNGEKGIETRLQELDEKLDAAELTKVRAEADKFLPHRPEGASEELPTNWDIPEPAPIAAAPAAPPSAPPPAPAATPGAPASAPPPAVTSAPRALPAAIGGERLRRAAEAGDPAAEYEVGKRYTAGRPGMANDAPEAAKWIARAAEKGYAPAQYRLAQLHEEGESASKDFSKAAELYQAAAEQGHAEAMHSLAMLYSEGKPGKDGKEGVPRDLEAAAQWFRKAAEHGLVKSQYNLGRLYQNGAGVDKDLSEAYKWFKIADNNGNPEAINRLREVMAAFTSERQKRIQDIARDSGFKGGLDYLREASANLTAAQQQKIMELANDTNVMDPFGHYGPPIGPMTPERREKIGLAHLDAAVMQLSSDQLKRLENEASRFRATPQPAKALEKIPAGGWDAAEPPRPAAPAAAAPPPVPLAPVARPAPAPAPPVASAAPPPVVATPPPAAAPSVPAPVIISASKQGQFTRYRFEMAEGVQATFGNTERTPAGSAYPWKLSAQFKDASGKPVRVAVSPTINSERGPLVDSYEIKNGSVEFRFKDHPARTNRFQEGNAYILDVSHNSAPLLGPATAAPSAAPPTASAAPPPVVATPPQPAPAAPVILSGDPLQKIKDKYRLEERYKNLEQELKMTYGITLPPGNYYRRGLDALAQYETAVREGKSDERVKLFRTVDEGNIFLDIANTLPGFKERMQQQGIGLGNQIIFAEAAVRDYVIGKKPELNAKQREDLFNNWAALKMDMLLQLRDVRKILSSEAAPSGPAAPVPAPAAVPPATGATPPAAVTPPPASQPAGGYAIDLGGAESESNAKEFLTRRWQQIQANPQFANLLKGLQPRLRLQDGTTPGSVETRLIAGPITRHDQADKLCAELKANGLTCGRTEFIGKPLEMSAPAPVPPAAPAGPPAAAAPAPSPASAPPSPVPAAPASLPAEMKAHRVHTVSIRGSTMPSHPLPEVTLSMTPPNRVRTARVGENEMSGNSPPDITLSVDPQSIDPQSTYTRYRFHVPPNTQISSDRRKEEWFLKFTDATGKPLRVGLPAGAHTSRMVTQLILNGGSGTEFRFRGEVDARSFKEGNDFIVDILNNESPAPRPPAVPPQPSAPAPAAAPPPESATATSTPVPRTNRLPDNLRKRLNELPAAVGPKLRVALQSENPAPAAYEIAQRLKNGEGGVTQDTAQAFMWMNFAQRENFVPAIYAMGSFFEKGIGVAKDPAMARQYLERAAERGHVEAMHDLAVLSAGSSDNPDYAKAAPWFLKAAERGDPDSQFNIGLFHEGGFGVEKNPIEAYKWFALAAQHNQRAEDKQEAEKERDKIYNSLDERSKARARAAVQNWRVTPQPDEVINLQVPHGGWDGPLAAAAESLPPVVARPPASAAPVTSLLPPAPAAPPAVKPHPADRLPIGSRLREAARGSDPAPAEYEIARRYREGRDGLPKDPHAAAFWFASAAAHGFAPAQYDMGVLLQKGEDVPKDLDAARQFYERAATQGHASAMHNLGVLYKDGLNGAKDYAKAEFWFRKGAEHGHPGSQFNLAVLHAAGLGVKPNPAEAYKWFALAAEAGDAEAAERRDQIAKVLSEPQKNAAEKAVREFVADKNDAETPRIPEGGWAGDAPVPPAAAVSAAPAPVAPPAVVPPPRPAHESSQPAGALPVSELPASVSPALRAAAQGENWAPPAYEIGMRYSVGAGGLPKDPAKAVEWMTHAANVRFAPADYALGSFYERGLAGEKNLERARFYYEEAAKAGHAEAMHNLGVLYAKGIKGTPEYDKAAAWFRKAADHGNAGSQYNLGLLYKDGLGVDKNPAEAYKWLTLAAKTGDKEAIKERDALDKTLDANSKARAKAAAQGWHEVPQPDAAINLRAPSEGWDAAAAPPAASRPPGPPVVARPPAPAAPASPAPSAPAPATPPVVARPPSSAAPASPAPATPAAPVVTPPPAASSPTPSASPAPAGSGHVVNYDKLLKDYYKNSAPKNNPFVLDRASGKPRSHSEAAHLAAAHRLAERNLGGKGKHDWTHLDEDEAIKALAAHRLGAGNARALSELANGGKISAKRLARLRRTLAYEYQKGGFLHDVDGFHLTGKERRGEAYRKARTVLGKTDPREMAQRFYGALHKQAEAAKTAENSDDHKKKTKTAHAGAGAASAPPPAA